MHRGELKQRVTELLKQHGCWPEDVEAKRAFGKDFEVLMHEYESEVIQSLGEDIESLRHKVNARWKTDIGRISGAIRNAIDTHRDVVIPAGKVTMIAKFIWNNILEKPNEVKQEASGNA